MSGAPHFSLAGDVLRLEGMTPIAEGLHRDVFAVPGQPDMLVKVRGRKRTPLSDRPVKRSIRALLPETRFRVLLIDAVHEMIVATRLGDNGPASPLSKCFGIIATDRGPGVLAERICDASGALAPRLVDLHKRGALDAATLDLLNDFCARLFDMGIIAGDLHERNIVLGLRGGETRFFLVDGIGDRHAIPIRTWFQWINARSHNRKLGQVADRLNLIWHSDRRAFSMPGHSA